MTLLLGSPTHRVAGAPHRRSATLLILLPLLCLLAAPLTAQKRESDPFGYIGLFGGLAFNAHVVSIDPLELTGGQPAPSDPLFVEGEGTRTTGGLLFEFPFSGSYGLGARLGWANRGGEMVAQYENRVDVATAGGTSRPANVEGMVRSNLTYVTLTPHFRVMPKSLPLYFLAGPSILVPFDMTYRYTETIITEGPLVFRGVNSPQRDRVSAGRLPSTPVRIALTFGLGLELFVTKRIAIIADAQFSPMAGTISSGFGSDDVWRADMASLTLGMKAGFGARRVPQPEPEPLPAGDSTDIDTTQKVIAGIVTDAGLTDTLVARQQKVKQTEMRAFLPYIFFERNTDTIPSRYKRIAGREVRGFQEERLGRGSTLEVYYQLLNVIGSRMRRNRRAELTITGHVGQLEEADSTLGLRRAEAARNYLRDVWRVREDKMVVVGAGLPDNPSLSEVDRNEGDLENSRVEFYANDLSILAPVRLPDSALLEPAGVIRLLTPPPDIPDSIGQLESWEVNIRIGDSLVERAATGYGPPPEQIDVELKSRPYMTRRGPIEITSELIILDSLFSRRKAVASTPVWFVEEGKFEVERNVENGMYVDRYNLLLYSFDSAGIFDFTQQANTIFQERITPQSRVEIIGHTDRIGLPYYNKQLSQRRADVAAGIIGFENAKVTGAGENTVLFDNDLPEGRYLSRTVTVIITTPVSAVPASATEPESKPRRQIIMGDPDALNSTPPAEPDTTAPTTTPTDPPSDEVPTSTSLPR